MHAHTYLTLSGMKSLSAFEFAAIFDELHHTAATGIGKKKGSWRKEQERGIEVAFYADTAEKPLELLAEPYHNPTAALRAALVWQANTQHASVDWCVVMAAWLFN